MIEIDDFAKFSDLRLSGKPTLMFFYAQWQDDSLNVDLKDLMSAMTLKYPSIEFCMVEAERVLALSEKFKISVVPTFVAICGDTTVGKVEGAAPADLSRLAKQLSTVPPQPVVFENHRIPTAVSTSSVQSSLKNLINTAPVMLFMKGSPDAPKCGFSRQIVEILTSNNIPFASFDILTDETVRAGLKTYSDWPTFPQLYVTGEFVGGLDIIKEIAHGGDLKTQLGIDKFQMPPPMPTIQERMVALINQSSVMIFIKGTPSAPRCGFSRTLIEILNKENIKFSSFDILSDEDIRSGLKTFSDWPTYPQLYVNGDFMGGLDIIKEMQLAGSLKAQFGV